MRGGGSAHAWAPEADIWRWGWGKTLGAATAGAACSAVAADAVIPAVNG